MMGLTASVLAQLVGGRIAAGHDCALGPASIDSRSVEPAGTFFCIRGPRFDGQDFARVAHEKGASTLVVRESGLPHLPAELRDGRCTVVAVGEPERALVEGAREARRRFRGEVIGVTGSSGKTTTKDQLAAVLGTRGTTLATRGNQNNQLGLPLTLLRLTEDTRFAVIEMGMNSPGEIALLAAWAQPRIGVITSVGAAHLEGVGSLSNVAREKGALFQALPLDGLAFMPEHIEFPWIVTRGLHAALETVGRGPGRGVRLLTAREDTHGAVGRVRLGARTWTLSLQTPGAHTLENALLALAVGRALGVDIAPALAALAAMPPSAMRGEIRTLADGRRVLLDCYNANPQSMRAALRSFRQRAPHGLLVLGDMLELGPASVQAHAEIGHTLGDFGGALLGVGPLSRALVDAARASGLDAGRARWVADAAAALDEVRALAAPGGWTLLKGSRGMGLERIWTGLSGETRGEH
ncbi:MAG: UDP-N-acetylmuramoyl-tripeptide--D-alanyl-D-alanine ligase [Bradymonadia bacterium]